MSELTKIEWATHTFNPWEGCTKVSPGCAHCYAEARNQRFSKGANWGKGKPRRRTSFVNWKKPIKWSRECAENETHPANRFLERPRIFPSLCDIFDSEVPIEWLADYLQLVFTTQNLDHLILTKRPEDCLTRIHSARDKCFYGARPWIQSWLDGSAPANVWIGTSVEDQQRADERIPALLKIPARVRFLSIEPLLAPVDIVNALPPPPANVSFKPGTGWAHLIQWIICGGESGKGARPCHIEWIRSIVAQCKAAGVPCFTKQAGSNAWLDGKQIKFRHPKGGDISELPQDIQIREFPCH